MELNTAKNSISRQSLIPQNFSALAEKFLRDGGTPAKAVYQIAKKLFGPEFCHWECETVELELKRLFKEIPEENLGKIFACMSIDAHENIILDQAHVFKNFAVAFNNESSKADSDEIIHVGQAAWAVIALKTFDPAKNIYLDHEPVTYLARLMHEEGMLLAPEGLSFVQESLNSLNRNLELIPEIQKALEHGVDKNMSALVLGQVEKLRMIKSYMALMLEDQEDTLKELSRTA